MIDLKSQQILTNKILACERCAGLSEAIYPYGKAIGLSYVRPSAPISIMFVAESPPDRGFFYDERESAFRNKLFNIINLSGLGPITTINEFNDKKYYLADAINCRWNKNIKSKRNVKIILRNCIDHLSAQIDLFRPLVAVAMGDIAREAINGVNTTHTCEMIVETPFIVTRPVRTNDLVAKLKPINSILE